MYVLLKNGVSHSFIIIVYIHYNKAGFHTQRGGREGGGGGQLELEYVSLHKYLQRASTMGEVRSLKWY